MSNTAIGLRPTILTSVRTMLTFALWGVMVVHAAVVLALGSQSVAASRFCTAAIPGVAALCCLWRAERLAARERIAWRWLSLSLLLWAAGQVVETLIGQSTAASNLSVDASDFLYITAAFPLLRAVSSTRETESIRAINYLDSVQIGLAFVLAYVRLFQMKMPPDQAATVMGWIYGVECSLLAIFAIFRLVSWSTLEERRRVRTLSAVIWIYLPIELGMDYATRRWNLRAGTLLDLLWSVPFLFAAWRALNMPRGESGARDRKFGRGRLLLESLCPMLVTAGIFALAASIVGQHTVLGLSAIFLLLVIQSLHSGVMHSKYLVGQDHLLEREKELREANSTLEKLSLLDPLTGVPNRRRFTAALEEAWRRGLRSKGPVAVLMIDVDFFKGINDMHGHTYGDQCLTTISHALSGQIRRADDLLARYGGEEFVVLLAETNEQGAMVVAERMQNAVNHLQVVNEASPFDRRLTTSIGVGVCVPHPELNPGALVEIADQALYDAKHLGKNRVCVRTQTGGGEADGGVASR